MSEIREVRFERPLDPITERWFTEFLMKWSAFLLYDVATHRLMGYGVYDHEWDNFRFWLLVGLSGEDQEDIGE